MIIVAGVLVLMAAVIATGLGESMRAAWEGTHRDFTKADPELTSHESRGSGIGARLEKRVPFLKKLSSTMDRIHESDSPWIAWVSGVRVGMPNTIYLAAIALLVHAHFDATPQVGSLVIFNVLSFGVVLVALSAVMAPAWTGLNYLRINAWITGASQRSGEQSDTADIARSGIASTRGPLVADGRYFSSWEPDRLGFPDPPRRQLARPT